ncbi:MAG: hypothetical protein ACJ75Z_10830 [Solirubrobacterales bacterium]
MGRRLAAAGIGAALIVAAILAFSLGKHPVIAGTNSAAPRVAAVPLSHGETHCQLVSRVPAAVSHVRVLTDHLSGPPGDLRLRIIGMGGQVFAVARSPVHLAGMVMRLKPPTRDLHPARVCVTYLGQGRLVLAGEMKRIPSTGNRKSNRREPVASLVFLRPGLASWASRRDVIAERYGNAQTGWLGGWTLWLALAAGACAALLALWWLVLRLDFPVDQRRRPGGRAGTSEDQVRGLRE